MSRAFSNLAAMTVSVAAFQVLASTHAGPECWIQGLNYLVAGVPFGLATSHAMHFRRTGTRRSRRIALLYLMVCALISAYSWHSVGRHYDLLVSEERALQPTIQALRDYHAANRRYPDSLRAIDAAPKVPIRFDVHYEVRDSNRFSIGFVHNIFRKHSYLSETGRWLDWD